MPEIVELTIKNLSDSFNAKLDVVLVQIEVVRKDMIELQEGLRQCRNRSELLLDSLRHEVTSLQNADAFESGCKKAKTEWSTIFWAALTALATASIVLITVLFQHHGGKP